MGNTWTGTSDDKLIQAEKHLLRLGGLEEKDYKIRFVSLADSEEEVPEDVPPPTGDYL